MRIRVSSHGTVDASSRIKTFPPVTGGIISTMKVLLQAGFMGACPISLIGNFLFILIYFRMTRWRMGECASIHRAQRVVVFVVAICVAPWLSSLGVTYNEIRLTPNGVNVSGVLMEGDQFGRLHIAYERSGEIFYQCRHHEGASLISEEWVCPGSMPSLALGPDGTPNMLAVSSGQVFFASRFSDSWTSRYPL